MSYAQACQLVVSAPVVPASAVASGTAAGTPEERVLYAGVDVAKASFTVAVYGGAPGREESRLLGEFANTAAGRQKCSRQVQRLQQAGGYTHLHLVCESTGSYEEALVELAFALGWRVTHVNAGQVRQWANGMGRRVKTDAEDAQLLARFGAASRVHAELPVPEDAAELDDLVQRQRDLKQLLQAEQNRRTVARLRRRHAPAALASLERNIEHLQQELAAIEQAIADFHRRSAPFNTQGKLLQTVGGVGPKVANTLLVLFHYFHARTAGTGNAKQLTAFVGLDPCPYQSGTSVAKPAAISRMGDAPARAALFMAALSAATRTSRNDSPVRQFYLALINRGKPKMVALIACARKILVWAWAVFTSGQPFDPARARPKPSLAPIAA